MCIKKSSLLTSFSIFYYTKNCPPLLIRTKYSKIHRRLLTLFFQSSIIALIEIFSKGKYHVTKLKQTFIGRPLKSLTEGEGGLLGKMQALAMLSSDALSSIAYGPEQVVLVLTSLSPLAIWWSLPIGLFVLLLLASLTVSYRQIIHAYPQGGGAYMVTRENLSPELGLIAEVVCWLTTC